jgi:hypothetical protein
MKFIRSSIAIVGLMGFGCGSSSDSTGGGGSAQVPVGQADSLGYVVQSRATFEVRSHESASSTSSSSFTAALVAEVPVVVTNAASSSMTLDKDSFIVPVITDQILDFGFLQLTDLKDNNLKVCGTNGNQKCNTALIRMYTTGVAGAGLYNGADGYGAPIEAGQSSLVSVGLGSANAAIMQSISIPSNKNVMKLSDFTNPKYNVKIDFSNAGAGSYSTTLVVEYVLAP